MKRVIILLICVIGVTATAYPQLCGTVNGRDGEGLFGYGVVSDEVFYGALGGADMLPGAPGLPRLPNHGQTDNQTAPLGGGTLLLVGLGAAYALKSKRRK